MAKMSDEHKAALAKGRAQSRAVRDYLNHLDAGRKRGPKVSRETLESRIAETRKAIDEADDPAHRLELIQKRMDDEDRLANLGDETDGEALEAAFVDAAKEYGERKGISYSAWRELGVSAAVLKSAGVPRTRRG